MQIELKAIQHSAFASQETNCYQANLYVDGKKIGTVSNAGHGGCDDFHGDRDAYAKADEWCCKNLPKWRMNGEDHDTDLEQHCGDLLTTWLITRDYKRAIKTKLLMTYDDKEGVYEIKHGGFVEKTAEQIRAQRPNVTILNTLPIAEAVEIFRAKAGA